VKALQTRCKAIHNSVKVYNAAAAQLDPPRPSISWEQVSHINFLEEFNLLNNTQQDIRDKQWSQPGICKLMKTFQRVKRAREEIEHCNFAICRLYTAALDKNDTFSGVLSQLQLISSPVYGVVKDFADCHRRVNSLILALLKNLTHSQGFSGNCSRGMQIGSNFTSRRNDKQVDILVEAAVEDDKEMDTDELMGELVSQLVDYIGELVILP
jgi:hypothetical protein